MEQLLEEEVYEVALAIINMLLVAEVFQEFF
jgi:hypothetical protein